MLGGLVTEEEYLLEVGKDEYFWGDLAMSTYVLVRFEEKKKMLSYENEGLPSIALTPKI